MRFGHEQCDSTIVVASIRITCENLSLGLVRAVRVRKYIVRMLGLELELFRVRVEKYVVMMLGLELGLVVEYTVRVKVLGVAVAGALLSVTQMPFIIKILFISVTFASILFDKKRTLHTTNVTAYAIAALEIIY